jgi:hypothetical protein
MPYSSFTTISKVKEAFNLTTVESVRFLPNIDPIPPSQTLTAFLEESLPLASSASEKARSEGIIYPVLLEARRILQRRVSLFSGEDFTAEEILEIEAPAVIIVEAKKSDLRTGFGQCIAEMVAAQKFNEAKKKPIPIIYGSVTNGTQWRFLKLEGQIVTIDLIDYPLPPVDQVLGFLVWMAREI